MLLGCMKVGVVERSKARSCLDYNGGASYLKGCAALEISGFVGSNPTSDNFPPFFCLNHHCLLKLSSTNFYTFYVF